MGQLRIEEGPWRWCIRGRGSAGRLEAPSSRLSAAEMAALEQALRAALGLAGG